MKSVIIQYYHLRHSLYLLCNLFPFLDYSLLAWYLVINHMVIGFAFIFFQVLDMMLYNSCRSSNCYSDKYSNRYICIQRTEKQFSLQGKSGEIGIYVSESFLEEVTSELNYEEHIGVFHVDKGGKATACAKAELRNSMLYSKMHRFYETDGVKMLLESIRS